MDFQAFIASNQAFSALAGAGIATALVATLLTYAKSVPQHLARLFMSQCVVTLTVYDSDRAYDYLSIWFGRHADSKRARRLGVAEWWDHETERSKIELTPGSGLHVFRSDKRWFFVRRSIEEGKSDGFTNKRKQTLTIMTFGRSQQPLHDLIAKSRNVNEDENSIPVFLWTGNSYTLVERRPKRSLDTVYLNKALKAGVIADVERFLARKQWYAARGVPYRRGYSFEGPPGTGKTTFIFAIASHIGRAIYIINPSAVSGDNGLQAAINEAGSGVVVIEDIDAIKASEARDPDKHQKPKEKKGAGEAMEEAFGGITLSGLLNAIDGIASRDGRLLFITSNHADALDPALMRPGRVDKRAFLDLAGACEAEQMFRRFHPDQDPAPFLAQIAHELPLSPATLQNRLLAEDIGIIA
ncbi:AAA+ ATPase [Bajunvirus bajun]|uniref:AAA+ ATPase n=1 Tax=Brevundimonas phage vB_BgoS-Bajun TaxID=2948594 RepID=A0A9E7N4E2_9CAUD|nr:AAA+ ATPase [Brevundimonas phage vB_BgoS-Bajun]